MSVSNAIWVAGQLAETKRMFHAVEVALSAASSSSDASSAVISVTSAVPGEGKSLIAAALALVAARSLGRPVLLVDANWFAPALHRYLDCQGAVFDVATWRQRGGIIGHVLPVPAGEHMLFLLPAPSRCNINQADLLEPLVREARKVYALTIFDTAAITSVNRHMLDPVNLSSCVDGTLLTVMINSTPRPAVRQAQKQIEAGGGRLLGVIVNDSCNPLAAVPGSGVKREGGQS